ncbi:GcrA family cell cycle regulator [Halocynthiibacter styelae]|uniref:Uncharacterized protein n=1 Tax=Halocynthiibacter styelae TaxID=2761955 RepID=A0A8J7INB1_9RHOB|nr:GcrA family cell cycle regulator [Paenihalocynthiibacter styelae]MBI1492036.1 hypothetical protein [Paenihalocynthiibacter styelae]
MRNKISNESLTVLENLATNREVEGLTGSSYRRMALEVLLQLEDMPDVTSGDDEKSYSIGKIRETYPNAYASWSDEDDAKLIDLHEKGVKESEIATEMGRQINAIRNRVLKIKGRRARWGGAAAKAA